MANIVFLLAQGMRLHGSYHCVFLKTEILAEQEMHDNPFSILLHLERGKSLVFGLTATGCFSVERD